MAFCSRNKVKAPNTAQMPQNFDRNSNCAKLREKLQTVSRKTSRSDKLASAESLTKLTSAYTTKQTSAYTTNPSAYTTKQELRRKNWERRGRKRLQWRRVMMTPSTQVMSLFVTFRHFSSMHFPSIHFFTSVLKNYLIPAAT